MKKLLFLFVMLAFGLTSFTQTNTFNNGGSGGDWNVDGNWSLNHVPLATENVVIPDGENVTIQSTTNAVAYSVSVNGGGSLTDLGTLTIEITTVTSGEGRIWMDRNLGASQVATDNTDAAAYGDLYQWGRFTEGHQIRTSGATLTQATTSTPGAGNDWDGLFITPDGESDWLSSPNSNLWQGLAGTNNPCPSGFRIPTQAEWDAEITSWGSGNANAAGAFASPLKLTIGGFRARTSGEIAEADIKGYYWTSATDGIATYFLLIDSEVAITGPIAGARADGYSVRCIKD